MVVVPSSFNDSKLSFSFGFSPWCAIGCYNRLPPSLFRSFVNCSESPLSLKQKDRLCRDKHDVIVYWMWFSASTSAHRSGLMSLSHRSWKIRAACQEYPKFDDASSPKAERCVGHSPRVKVRHRQRCSCLSKEVASQEYHICREILNEGSEA